MTNPAERITGLNEQMRDFLTAHSTKIEKNGKTHTGTLNVPYYLNQYILADGRILQEHVQAEYGEVGDRMIFIALRDPEGAWVPGSLWTRDSIWLASF